MRHFLSGFLIPLLFICSVALVVAVFCGLGFLAIAAANIHPALGIFTAVMEICTFFGFINWAENI